jgi:hypothetical protein
MCRPNQVYTTNNILNKIILPVFVQLRPEDNKQGLILFQTTDVGGGKGEAKPTYIHKQHSRDLAFFSEGDMRRYVCTNNMTTASRPVIAVYIKAIYR